MIGGGAVARLKAIMGLETKEFDAGIQKAKTGSKSLGASFKDVAGALGVAFSVGAVVAWGKTVLQWAGKISDAASSVGVMTSEMLAMSMAFEKNGMSADELVRMMAKVEADVFGAAMGTKKLDEIYTKLGFTTKSLAAMAPDERFRAVAKAAMESANATGALAEVFGAKLGPKAIEALQDIVSGFIKVDAALGVTLDKMSAAEERMNLFFSETKKTGTQYFAWWIGQWQLANDVIASAMEFAGNMTVGGKGPIAIFRELRAEREARERRPIERRRAQLAKQQQDLINAAESTTGAEDEGTNKKAEGEALKFYHDHVARGRKEHEERMRLRRAERDQRLKDAEAVASLEKRLSERLISIRESARGVGVQADAFARIGGFMGGERSGLAARDREITIQIESRRAVEENTRAVNELKDEFARRGDKPGYP